MMAYNGILRAGKRPCVSYAAVSEAVNILKPSQPTPAFYQYYRPFHFRTVSSSQSSSFLPEWATADPRLMGTTEEPYTVSNLVNGNWVKAKSTITIPHPMDCDAHPIFAIPDTTSEELGPFIESLKSVPKSGVHNPLKNPNRYVEYGEISRKVSVSLHSQHLVYFFVMKAQNRLDWKNRAKNGLINALCH